jgi:hypothetical protein
LSASDPQPAARPPEPQLDLNAAGAQGNLVVSAETREDPLDQQHRHEQESADAALRRWKDKVRFSLSTALLVALTGFALYLALNPGSTPDEKTGGRVALFSLLTGIGGYFIGRAGKE